MDVNQADIVKALRKIGAFVQPLHRLGQGVPDLLVGWRQRWLVMEVKRDERAELTPDEKAWIEETAGRAPVVVVTSALEAVGYLQGVRP
ncbi:MAG TPA: hypothetical protein VF516_03300 [Kofleriaceae bacterium]